MNPSVIFASDHPFAGTHPDVQLTVRVKELSERDRRRMLMHFLALADSDRLLRFGTTLPDELITRYVQKLDFVRDTVFGVYDNNLRLIGVGHLGFAPRDALPAGADATTKERVAEFGLSVSESARGMGVGTKLFERAAIHCRNADVDTLYMHCLSSNRTMIRIAHKAGMQIRRSYGEADAYLKLLPANVSSVMLEAVQEQVAQFDYAYKANNRAAIKWFNNYLPGFK
ncbi:GNAT family N-acetyltransferase [Actimicrobium sp. CCC2.4]|uniref:GNAT family N-acetyltransferase n=1 Tax=Actimicrobium sp. CCC2.4 TaxID=3048606 RepID=UPI002AC9EC3B|nr:GNAT family N-acetyltransferase [Actimicrobium sp. CCC2.4]MEB0134228.1 GNAT family N-acetyltransferase [Actimicrobium sp. CCC2.4]WPX32878.1 GNAT family N-acetyltransferase [Actimicrobium sp. CCC2.4]